MQVIESRYLVLVPDADAYIDPHPRGVGQLSSASATTIVAKDHHESLEIAKLLHLSEARYLMKWSQRFDFRASNNVTR